MLKLILGVGLGFIAGAMLVNSHYQKQIKQIEKNVYDEMLKQQIITNTDEDAGYVYDVIHFNINI